LQNEPRWLLLEVVLAIHEAQLAEHGGKVGIRDANLLESALARPQNRFQYEPSDADIPALAAVYATAIIQNHPFIDGNKRVGLVLLGAFLRVNRYRLEAGEARKLQVILALASGQMSEAEMIRWTREHAQAMPSQTG
jgi:death-on-curing protein